MSDDTKGLFRQVHKAKCSSCGFIAKTSADSGFISLFFLPRVCPGCGEDMPANGTFQRNHPDLPHWVHVARKERLVRQRRTFNPLTWVKRAEWRWHDEYQYPAS